VPAHQRLPTPLFDEFSDEEFAEFVQRLQVHAYEPGQIIVKEGTVGDSMYVLSNGSLEVLTGVGGHETKLADLRAGDFFGESALLSGRPRTATIRASELSECLVLSRDDFNDMVTMHPRVKTVVEDFNRKRALSTVETLLKKKS
jgi:cAMP-dependent protein kinase regulator